MNYITNTLEFHIEQPSVITFGKFDGLHRGHELLMEEMKRVSSSEQLASIAFTFQLPPRSIVDAREHMVLTTNEEKRMIFARTGIDYLIECPFTREVMCMSPEAFLEWIVEKLSVRVIVVGTDFRFGRDRAGDYHTIRQMEERFGYRTIVLDKVQDHGRDISSTYIREELVKGHIEKVNELLGYRYFVRSTVVHGNQIGRTIGIPTINMVLPRAKLLPPFGVYVTRVKVDGRWYKGVTNVGCKPTIDGVNPIGVETFILDFSKDIYDREITVEFYSFVRPEMKFNGLAELKEQMSRDIRYARIYCEENK